MSIELELARVLAREVAYRSRRRFGKRGVFSLVIGKYKPSVLQANILGAALFSFLSLMMTLVLIFAPPEEIYPLFIGIFSTLLLFGLFMSLLMSIGFTSVYVSERLADLMILLPLDERTLTKVYLLALFLYWGGASVIFLFVPPLAILLFKSASPILFAVALLSSLMLLMFSYSLGLAIGTYAQLVKKKSILRALATVAWLVVLLGFYSAGYLVEYLAEALSLEYSYLYSLIPFIGPLFYQYNTIGSVISVAATIGLAISAYLFAVDRLGVLTGQLPPAAVAPKLVKVKPKVRAVRAAKVEIKSSLLGFILKDLRILVREPRRLANLLYFLAFPLIMLVPTLTRAGAFETGFSKALLLGMCGLIGGAIGLVSDVMYYIEGEGAKVLYYLPITRRKLALMKTAAVALLILVASTLVAAVTAVASGSILLSALIFILTASLALSTSLISSSITAHFLPEYPSSWTEATVSKAVQIAVKIVLIILVSAMSFAIPFAILATLGEQVLYLAPLIESLVLVVIALTVFIGLAKEKSL